MSLLYTLFSLFLLSACAGFVQRVSGFGFGIFMMMFLPYIMPSYNEAVALSGILSGTTALFIVLRNIRHVCWRRIPVVLFFNLVVSFFIIRGMANAGGDMLHRALGVSLILVALYFVFFEGKARGLFRSWWSCAAAGALSGVMGSMFAMPGPPVVMYGVSVIHDKRQYMATMQAFWLLFNLFYLFFRSGHGYYTAQTPVCWGVGLCGVILGVAVGAVCFNRMSNGRVRKVVYLMMFVSGAVALIG
jgi:uncharacterized membrane protein YfcA